MRSWPLLSIGFSLLALCPRAAGAVPVYGPDDRKDLYEVSSDTTMPATEKAEILKLARSTVALFSTASVRMEGDTAVLETRSFVSDQYGEEYDLVPTERFYGQPSGAKCSGMLIAPDIVLTAGHCIPSPEDCKDKFKFVFDFAIPEKGHDPTRVPAESVYGCAMTLNKEDFHAQAADAETAMGILLGLIDLNPDWALVKLDRPVKDRQPLGVSRSTYVVEGTPLFMIGYPRGLPAKYAGNAKVLKEHYRHFIASDEDGFCGNSGSPIFNAKTRLIEGVVSSTGADDYDFVFQEGLGKIQLKSKVIAKPDESNGVQATKVSAFRDEMEKVLAQQSVAKDFDGQKAAPGK